MVLMHVHTFQLYPLAVQEESLVGIEGDMPYSCDGLVSVCNDSVSDDLSHYAVQVRIFTAPQAGTLDRNDSKCAVIALCRDTASFCCALSCDTAFRVNQFVPQPV